MNTKGPMRKPFTKDERRRIRKYIRSMDLSLEDKRQRLEKLAQYDSPRSVTTSRKSTVNKGHLIHDLLSPSQFSDEAITTRDLLKSIAAQETRRGEPGNIPVRSSMGRRGRGQRRRTRKYRRRKRLTRRSRKR